MLRKSYNVGDKCYEMRQHMSNYCKQFTNNFMVMFVLKNCFAMCDKSPLHNDRDSITAVA